MDEAPRQAPAAEDMERLQRKKALYQKLLLDREFREFILDDWLGGMHTEMLDNLRLCGDPAMTHVHKELWRLAETQWQHMQRCVDGWRAADKQAAEAAEARKQREAAGEPPEANPE